MSKDDQGAIFIADFAGKCIREKVNTQIFAAEYIQVITPRSYPYPVSKEQDGKEIPESEFRLQHQVDISTPNAKEEWLTVHEESYNRYPPEFRRIIAIPIEPEIDNGIGLIVDDFENQKETFVRNPNFGKPIEPEKRQYLGEQWDELKNPQPDTSLQPVKDEGAMAWLKKEGYPNVMPMTLDNLGIILDRYTKYLSSPPEPASKEQEGDAVGFAEEDVKNIISMVCDQFNAGFAGREEFINNTIQLYKKKP